MEAHPSSPPAPRWFAMVLAGLLLGGSFLQAAGYLKIGDIKGEATDNDHKDWIIIESMSSPIFRALQTDATTGHARHRGDAVLGDIVCTKELDKSSPKIAEAVCEGTTYPEVEIRLTRSFASSDGTGAERRVPYLTYKLKNVLVSSYSFHGSAAGDPLPTEEITLGYTEVEWTYHVLDERGAVMESVTGACSTLPHPQ